YFCEKIYSDKFENIIEGSRQFRWEGIEVINNNKTPENYYKFYYEQCDNIPTQQEVDQFFNMAGRIGFRISGELQTKLVDMGWFDKLRSKKDDTKSLVEVYFKQDGITKLQEADRIVGAQAFQKANGFSAPLQHQPQANESLERYYQLKEHWLSLFY